MGKATYRKWLARVLDHDTPWEEREIIGFRTLVRRDPGAQYLLECFQVRAEAGVYRITPGQDRKGVEYLLSKSLKKSGKPRKGCRLSPEHLAVLRDLDHHQLVGIDLQVRGAYYVAIAKSGASFQYLGTMYEQMWVGPVCRPERLKALG